MHAEKDNFSILRMARVLKVSASGYHSWHRRRLDGPGPRAVAQRGTMTGESSGRSASFLTWFQRHQRPASCGWADAVRAFVHVEEVAHAVAGAVAVVHARSPQRRSRQCIDLWAAGAFREACA